MFPVLIMEGVQTMKPFRECIYYMVRELGGHGIPAKEVYVDDAIAFVRENGLPDMRVIELRALIEAANSRGKIAELDQAVHETDWNWDKEVQHDD